MPYRTMITLFVKESNPITPNFYNNLIANLPFHQLRCPCGHAGALSVHGYYYRHIKTSTGRLRFRICRVKCEACGKTHALLPSSFVPHSQIPLKDHIEIITAYESDAPTATILSKNDSADESSFRYIIRQYLKYWKQKLISEKINIHPISELIHSCFKCYSRQFMQIKCTPNLIFSYTT